MKLLTLLATVAIALPLVTTAQQKFSKVKFYPPSSTEERNTLLGNLDIDHFLVKGGAIISEISEDAVQLLKKQQVRYEILVDDVAADFVKKNRKEDFFLNNHTADRMGYETGCVSVNTIINTPAAFTAGAMSGYYTYSEMNAKMDNLAAAYPGIVTKF